MSNKKNAICEKSKVPVLSNFFKELYNGPSKQYPKNQKYNGQCSVLVVGGLHDLNTKVKLKTGQLTSLRELLKSIPATPGMTRPLLFQHFVPNSLKTVHMAVYQKMDHDYVMERTKSLEGEIALVLPKGEETKVSL